MRLSSDPFKNPYVWAYTAAILLHLLLMVLHQPLWQAFQIAPTVDVVPESPPLIFEFVDSPEAEASEAPPQQTPLLADRNLISRDQQTEVLPQSHLAFVDGISQAKEVLETSPGKQQDNSTPQEFEERQADQEEGSEAKTDSKFNFADVLFKDPVEAQKEREKAVLGRAALPQQKAQINNLQTRALEQGGLQLSTYAWDFAPYLAYLKQHIGGHVFPPRAFDMGLLEGNTQVRFRIWRDGRLEGPEMIEFEGSPMLRDTSVKAVELSAPFKPLPSDFPDDYLEIVGTFEYLILRPGRGQ